MSLTKRIFDKLPERKPWDHAIELVPDATPVSCKVYPMSVNEQQKLDEFLEENLRSGRIRPSKSAWASPFFFVKKKDGSLRPVQDYRKLNERTIKNRYPLPLISEMINLLKDAVYFTKFDVRWGFNNIRIKEGDEHKAAFLTNRGLYEPLVMFFGLTNSPATFQSTMYGLLKHLILAGKVMVYMDDILVFSKTLEEHREIVRQVLQILRENKLYLKAEKCDFEKTKIEYLGMIIWEGHVQMDPVKVQGVADWPEPDCKKDVQSFLGFTNFYRRFIRDYGRIAKPLTSLTGKVDWTWDIVQRTAFNGLKEAVTTAPVLILPDNENPFRVECDASDYALGAVLSQQRDGKWHPVAFLSKAMTETERNYEIYDKELLAVMTALSEWRHFLLGSKHEFEVWNDHKNLEYFRKPQKLNRRQARWVTELADYHFTLHHKPGKSMAKADLLSRRSDHDHGKADNSDVTVLKAEYFRASSFDLEGLDDDIVTQIKQLHDSQDSAVVKALANKERGWNDEDDLVTWEHRLYVPRSKKLREKVIRIYHDSITAGHPGRYKTQELITRNYWWPRIQADVKSYVEGCETCQRTKIRHGKHTAPLQPNKIPNGPWETITVDMIGPLPESQGHDAILVIVDWFSKEVIALPIQTEMSSEGWAREYITHVFSKHGLSRKVISDRGPQFVSKFIRDVYKLLGIEGNPSTAFHPQTDGQTERINQELEQYLRVFVNHRQNDWAEWLPLATFSYNDKIHSATGHSPFYINHGRHPWKGTEPRVETQNESASTFVKRMSKVREEASAALKLAQEQVKRFYDRSQNPSIEYKKGDRVWLEGSNIRTDRPTKKLDNKRHGPFKVIEKVGKSAYKLDLPKTWRSIHPVFNEVLLTPFVPPAFSSQKKPAPPPPVNVEQNIYEVEEVLDSKLVRNKLHYLVHWKGWPIEERTWEPAANLDSAKELVAKFHRKNPSSPRPKPPGLVRFVALENFTEPSPHPRMLFDWYDGVYDRVDRYLDRSRNTSVEIARRDS